MFMWFESISLKQGKQAFRKGYLQRRNGQKLRGPGVVIKVVYRIWAELSQR